MEAPVLPSNEHARLEALHALGLLDTVAEERFDRVTRIAAALFDVPIAYVALVDADRQWFKSSCGLAVDETSREHSFCGHAILENEMMVINDASVDSRFFDNPIVIGDPHIRFYAGQPLKAPGGPNVGTFCIADRSPRQLTHEEQRLLKDLAAMIERELNLEETCALEQQFRLLEESARQEVVRQKQALQHEINQAADYLSSILPAPIDGAALEVSWQFQPSEALGGDAFDYGWLDDDHFAVYLLDVCGHGVGAALLSVSIVNWLRTHSVSEQDLHSPHKLLEKLNRTFPMDQHQGMYFTIWYGVYHKRERALRFSSGGHPPALLLTPGLPPERLRTPSLMVGALEDALYITETVEVLPGASLVVYSDGIYETNLEETTDPLGRFIKSVESLGSNNLNELIEQLHPKESEVGFVDDCSVVHLAFH